MKSVAPGLIIILFILAVDLYTFKGLLLITRGMGNDLLRKSIHVFYWLSSAATIAAVMWLTRHILSIHESRDYQTFFTIAGLVLLMLVPKLVFIVFHFVEDLISGLTVLFGSPNSSFEPTSGRKISRSRFLTQLGLGVAAIPFLGMIYGMIQGRFDFRVVSKKLNFPNLPAAFSGLKIVQISDTHLGSFYGNHERVKEAFEMINRLEPDLILLTGDCVNNYADEFDGWEPYFTGLKARHGKYVVLGNHDYGDYIPWTSDSAKKTNLQQLINTLEKCGFNVLLNQHKKISIDNEFIDLIGVENWGKGEFSKYGDLEKAMNGSTAPFKMLMSHDPSHWDAQVRKLTNIDLTFSGHTHGMQFGIEVPGIKWSPAQYRYPRWGGLYKEEKQYLYVNRGLGYIGFPGRVGISPEITLLELFRA